MGIYDRVMKMVRGIFVPADKGGERSPEEDPEEVPREELDDPVLETDEQIVSYVEQRYREWYDARYPFEPVWFQNISNFMGFQYNNWNEITRSMSEGHAPSYRVKMVINLMMPAIKTYLGKFMRGDPIFACRPGESSDQAFTDARVGDKVARGLWRLLDGTDEMLDWLGFVLVPGHGFWKVGWDPTLGQRVDFPDGQSVSTGEIDWSVMGPFPILVPPEQKDIRRPSQIMECRVRHLRWLKQVYGEAAKDIAPDSDISDASSYEWRLSTLTSPTVNIGTTRRPRTGWGAHVREHWSDPETLSDKERAKYPNGRILVVANGKLLLKENSPFSESKKHPFHDAVGEKIPGRFWGMSILEQVTPLQKSYNRGRSQMVENRNLTSNPVLDVEKNHGITALTNEPGAVNERNKGWSPPTYRKPPEMAPHLKETVEDDRRDFGEVIQQSAASKGEIPGSNISGLALELAQESDNNPLTPLALRIARCLSRVMSTTLDRTRELYTEPRFLEISGEGQETEILLFMADQHRTKLRVECLVTSVLPASYAARYSRLETLTRLGYLNPQTDRAIGLRMMQFGDDNQIYEMADRDRSLQLRENQKLRQGIPVPVLPWHDHEVHVMAMMTDMKSSEWETFTPQQQMAYIQHWQLHLDAMAAVNSSMGPAQPRLGRDVETPDAPAIAGGLGALTQGGDV
jgi:hypothetical protein